MACSHPRCECMHGPEDCVFQEKNRKSLTNFVQGGKITCHKCEGFILETETDRIFKYNVFFHKQCFNPYEHYYGLDNPID